jgi:Leucine-rich repeat (LRR) protein
MSNRKKRHKSQPTQYVLPTKSEYNAWQHLLNNIAQAEAEGKEELNISVLEVTKLPPEIGRLTQLKRFLSHGYFDPGTAIEYYNLFTEIPPIVLTLKQLEMLVISEAKITTIPDTIATMTQLTHLDLSHNQITEIPAAIAAMQHLETLDLSNNQITAIPEALTTLPKLQFLDLRRNPIQPQIPDRILSFGSNPWPVHHPKAKPILDYYFHGIVPAPEAD